MDPDSMNRKDLQAAAKAAGIKANQKSDALVAALKALQPAERSLPSTPVASLPSTPMDEVPAVEEDPASRRRSQRLSGPVPAAVLSPVLSPMPAAAPVAAAPAN